MMKTAFDFWDRHGILEYSEHDVRIYDVDGHKYLFVGQTLFASTTERSWYIKNVMPHAKGRCLEIGLGLGVASKTILAKKNVSHLLTVEKNERVIAAFGRPLARHNILQVDINDWISSIILLKPSFDFIFVDHHADMEEEDTYVEMCVLVEQLKEILTEDGKLVVWLDENAPDDDQKRFRDLWVV